MQAEIISNYLERPNRNLSKLMDYARTLTVQKMDATNEYR